jgi:hypothetical protein
MNHRWLIIAIVAAIIVLVLPMPVAERYTSPTQDGQYLTNPARAYGFVIAAATASPSSELNTSGKALAHAKSMFAGSPLTPNRVELLYLGGSDSYEYITESGVTLSVGSPGAFVWEVWGTDTTASDTGLVDVIALLDYKTGDLLDSVEE